MSPHKIAGLIVAGGTGALFSLMPPRVVAVVKTARAAQPGQPVIVGCGHGPKMACDMAKQIEAACGDGICGFPRHGLRQC